LFEIVFIVFVLAMIAIVILPILLFLWVARRFGGVKVVWTVGLSVAALLIWSIIDIIITCSAEPIFVPPDCNDESKCGIGTMIFACDAPGGAFIYGYAYLVGPLLVIASIFLTFYFAGERGKNNWRPNVHSRKL
jgi:hypothetical protein